MTREEKINSLVSDFTSGVQNMDFDAEMVEESFSLIRGFLIEKLSEQYESVKKEESHLRQQLKIIESLGFAENPQRKNDSYGEHR